MLVLGQSAIPKVSWYYRRMLFPRALILSYGVLLALLDVVANALVSASVAR